MSIETLMKKVSFEVTVENEFEDQFQSIVENPSALSDHEFSNASKKLVSLRTEYCFSVRKHPIETLAKEIEPAVTERKLFQSRDEATLS